MQLRQITAMSQGANCFSKKMTEISQRKENRLAELSLSRNLAFAHFRVEFSPVFRVFSSSECEP